MRVASWTFVACMLLGMIGVFLPSLEAEVGGIAVSHRTTLSLYRAESNRELVRRWLAGYGKSHGKRVAGAILPVLLPRTKGALNDHLDDVNSAMTELERACPTPTSRRPARCSRSCCGRSWACSCSRAASSCAASCGAGHRRGSLALAALLALVIAAVAIGLYLGWGAAVFEVNDEIGHDVVQLAIGAYVAPLAALVGLVAMLAIIVAHWRAPARSRV